MYYAGVDIGGTLIKMGLFLSDGTLVEKWEIDTDVSFNGKNIIPDAADSIKSVLDKKNIKGSEVLGCGIGVPGAARSDGSVNKCVNLGWGDIQVAAPMSKLLFDVPVTVVNDANAAALGEYWMGAAKGYKDVVLMTLGTGVGGGIIIDDKVVAGKFAAGGEIGHITVETTDGRKCSCGKNGCLEQYASATGFVKTMEILGVSGLSAKDIFDKAKEGDSTALKAVEIGCRYIGLAFASIQCVVDPEIFVIGGGVSKAGDFITDRVKKYYKQFAFHTSLDTPIVIATLGNDAGIYGAAKAALSKN